MDLDALDAVLQANGITKGLVAHPRVEHVRDILDKRESGLHDRLMTSGDPAKIKPVLEMYEARHRSLVLEEQDPLRYGFRVPMSYVVDQEIARIREKPDTVPIILALGGNRASKSVDAARRVMELMCSKDNMSVAVLCPTQAQARDVAMAYLWRYFPPEWKEDESGKKKHGAKGSYSYNSKTGFTDDKFTLPNGSKCIFKFYRDGDVKAWEGTEYDLVWADEEVTQDWVDAAIIRLGTRTGTLLITFTPISGMTPVVQSIQAECSPVLSSLRNGGGINLPKKGLQRLATIERSPTKSVVRFWPEDNPYGGYKTLENLALSEKWTLQTILCRLYGFAHKVKDAAFPTFSHEAHSFTPSPEFIAKLHADAKKGIKPTWYHVVDPCSGRPFFMKWYMVLPGLGQPRAICMREWPQQGDDVPGWGDPGEWAVPSKDGRLKDGERGSAQEVKGLTVNFMHSEMDRVEHELAFEFEGADEPEAMIQPYVRLMDSRGGSVSQMAGDSNDTLIDEFYKIRPDGKLGRDFVKASGQNLNPSGHRSTDGIHLINDWLGYRQDEPLGVLNEPRLRFHERCANSLWALKNFTGADGNEGACKDPIDVDHYFVRDDPHYVNGSSFIIDSGRR
jgi:phage terminase large subunit-like protein